MDLMAKWTADSVNKYSNALNIYTIEDVTGNGNIAYGTNISVVYDAVSNKLGRILGVEKSFIERNIPINTSKKYLGFNGHSFMRILNSDFINLDCFTIKINFMFASNHDKSQYIFDKRNGQWHRNYCLLYAAPDFPHLRPHMKDKYYFLFDFGDSVHMNDDFDNGITLEVTEPNPGAMQEITISFSKDMIGMSISGNAFCFANDRHREIGNIMGNGDLIVGDSAWPHVEHAWPVLGGHPFYGCIEMIEIYNDVDTELFNNTEVDRNGINT